MNIKDEAIKKAINKFKYIKEQSGTDMPAWFDLIIDELQVALEYKETNQHFKPRKLNKKEVKEIFHDSFNYMPFDDFQYQVFASCLMNELIKRLNCEKGTK